MQKYAGILSILNLVLLIAATACLYFGSLLINIYLFPYLDTVNPHFATVPYIMLAIGGLLLVLSLYGFVAAGLQSRPLLIIYAVTAGVIVLLQLASVYVSWELRNELNNRLMFKQVRRQTVRVRLVQTGPPPCRGLIRGIASPAILCHKEPAQASKALLLAGSL